MKLVTCIQCEKEIEERDSFLFNFSKVCLKCYMNFAKVNTQKSIDFRCIKGGEIQCMTHQM